MGTGNLSDPSDTSDTSDTTDQAVPSDTSALANPPAPARRWLSWDTAATALFAAGAIGAGVWLMALGRGLTFFFDEWNFVDSRGRSFWATDLTPHNGHPVVVPFAIYRLTFALFGISRYWPYLLMVVLLNVLCGWLLFVLLRRKVHALIAASVAIVLMLLGPAWQDLLWPFQIGFLGSVGGGLAALVLLDRRRTTADIGAAVCILLALFSSGIGLTVVAGVTVELVWRRRSWRRLWVTIVPALVFGGWYIAKGRGGTTVTRSTLAAGAHFIGRSAAAAAGSLIAQGPTAGSVAAIVLAALVVVCAVTQPGACARLAMAVTGGISFWLLTLVTRGTGPDASRYLYPGAVYLLLAAGEVVHLLSARMPFRTRRGAHSVQSRRFLPAIATTVVVLAVIAYSGVAVYRNSKILRSGRGGLLGVSQQVRAELGAVQLVGRALPPRFRPDTTMMPQVVTGPYLAAVAAYGSPGLPSDQLDRQPAKVRTTVDAMVLRGLPMHITEVPVSPSTAVCRSAPTVGPAVFDLPAAGLWITASATSAATLGARWISPRFLHVPGGTIDPGTVAHLGWSSASTNVRWQIRILGALSVMTCKS